MKKKYLLGLLVALTLVLTACGSSSTHTYIIDDRYTEYLVMGTSADYPPFEWQGKIDGRLKVVGVDIEIAKEIAKSEGKNLRVVDKHFDFLLQDLESGKLDFVMAGMSATEQRKKRVSFSIDYYNGEQSLLISKDDIDLFKSLIDLNKKDIRIGAQIGSIQQEIVEELFFNSQTQFTGSVANLVSNLSQGNIKALLVETPVAESYINIKDDLAISEIIFANDGNNGFGVAINKAEIEFLNRVNIVLDNLIKTGELDKIFERVSLYMLKGDE